MTTAGETITMTDTDGNPHDLTSRTIFATLGIGWTAFGLSLIFNILYYALHPSDVTIKGINGYNLYFVISGESELAEEHQ